jgi:hypothetical protein
VARVPTRRCRFDEVIPTKQGRCGDLSRSGRYPSQHHSQNDDCRQIYQSRWQNAECTADIELPEADGAGPIRFFDQPVSNQESADREKDMHAERAVRARAGKEFARQTHVAEQHHRDSDGTPPIQRRQFRDFHGDPWRT